MSDLRDLYQEIILDHSRRPRHFETLDAPCCSADGHNPLCGDTLRVFLRTAGDRIVEASFQGAGCAISMASASMMTDAIRGATVAEVEAKQRAFHDLVTGKLDLEAAEPTLGKLAVFAGVSRFPVRVKCATLAWHTLRAALDGREAPATTE
jgi:nitrogen fixation NifU-like protein